MPGDDRSAPREKRRSELGRRSPYVVKAAERRPQRVEADVSGPAPTTTDFDRDLVRALHELLQEDEKTQPA